MCCLLQQKERRGKAINLLGSHRCLEVLVPQNHQENPEDRRQTRVLVIDAPWCKDIQLKNCSPCTQCSTLVDSRSQGSMGHPACLFSSKPFLLYQQICSVRSSTRPRALTHCSLLGPMKGNQKYHLQGSAVSRTLMGASRGRNSEETGRLFPWPCYEKHSLLRLLDLTCSHLVLQALSSSQSTVPFLSASCQPWACFIWQERFLQHHVERQRECA